MSIHETGNVVNKSRQWKLSNKKSDNKFICLEFVYKSFTHASSANQNEEKKNNNTFING